MSTSGYKRTPAGLRSQQINLTNPGTRARNDDGSYTTPRVPLDPPSAWGRVESTAPTSRRELQKVQAGTTLTVDMFIIVIPYHPQVTTRTQLAWEDRFGRQHVADVTGVSNPDQANIETVMVAVEQVP
jgi:hypothetical protein